MSIIVTEPGKKPLRIDASGFDRESALQELIHDSPEAIPLYEIKDDVRLLVLAREYPTESGPIDALGVDRDGDVYVIETKLRKNPDKRNVVAQVLDYGAALWRHAPTTSELESSLDASVRAKFGVGLRGKLSEFFELDEAGVEGLLSAVSRNLDGGSFKFVVPMDRVDDRLKDLIVFLNQNSRFDVYAVELECYRLDERTVIIPKLFGSEVRKGFGQQASRVRGRWDEESFLAEARQKLSGAELEALNRLYAFFGESADEVRFGTGSYASASPIFAAVSQRSALSLASDGRLSVNFDWIRNDSPEATRLLKEGLTAAGLRFADGWERARPGIAVAEWSPRVDGVVAALKAALTPRKP